VLSGKNIERVQKEKDIGVTIDSELTFESHICEKVNKATQIFGALRRAFRYLDKKLFIPLYKTMASCKISLSSPSVMFLKILVWSANRYTSDFIPSGKSLMNSMNNKGPNTEPGGISYS
jgi:hypothetical protein